MAHTEENWYTGYTDLIQGHVPLWIPIVPASLLPEEPSETEEK